MRFSFFLIFFMIFCRSFAQDFSGTWKGDLAIDKDTIALIFHIKQENSQWTAYMDIPLQDAFKLPAKVSIENNKINLETESEINIKGEMINANEIKAVFLQSGFEQALKFNRISDTAQLLGSLSFKRPQEPSVPFPYDSKDFMIEDSRVKLSGTITAPKAEGRFPAVLLISGSGTHDRDGEMFGHKPFKVLADYLSRKGFVVMRFDEIGIGGSVGDIDNATTLTEVMDVHFLLGKLKSELKVDPNKIGLIGHSEGSLISLIEASKNKDVKFIVSLAGMGLSTKEIMKKQNEEKFVGMPAEKKKLYYSLMEVMGGIEDDDITRKKMYGIVKNYKGKDPLSSLDTVSFGQMFLPWVLCITRLNPVDYITQINVPVLVLNGEKDMQVSAHENVDIFREKLPKNPKNFFKIYPDINHLFQKAKTGSKMEYKQIEETFNEEVMKDIVEWIEKL